MARIACLVAVMAFAATGAAAAGRHEHSRSSSPAAHHHHGSTPVAAPAPIRPAFVYPVVAGYVPSYASYSSYASRQPLNSFPRTTGPTLLYVPPSSPNAPPFSFNGSEELPGWNWQRVSLQQIDAEVRAKRAAAAAASGKP